MTTALVHWLDTPRLYLTTGENPKHEGLPKTQTVTHIEYKAANRFMDDVMAADYGKRTGYSVIGMFPHTDPRKNK